MTQHIKNRDVFLKDPLENRLVNQGVAEVAEPGSDQEIRTLRHELETFVCEGQYARGLERILSPYLASLDREEQPAVWVSGFYGSGKSHLVKMLRFLWTDYRFPDGATARGLAHLPDDIQAHLRELSTQGKRLDGPSCRRRQAGGRSRWQRAPRPPRAPLPLGKPARGLRRRSVRPLPQEKRFSSKA